MVVGHRSEHFPVQTTMPTIRLSKREARAALRHIDELQPVAPMELDWQECVLISLRGRLRDNAREVPADAWPDIVSWLEESPGILKEVLPREKIGGEGVADLAGQLMAWHVWALFTPGIDPMAVLVSEGLLNALIVEPQTVAGGYMTDFVKMVRG